MNNLKDIPNIHILLVEDNAGYLRRLLRRLDRFGYQQITSARSTVEARELLSQRHFDIIVADMRMEEDDSGFKVIDEVKKHNLSSIVIILTANDTVVDCRKALKGKGAWDYIPKTFPGGSGMEALHDSIKEAITYFNRWGNFQDETWINDKMDHLRQNYLGKYVAVLNNSVIESADTKEELEQRIQERKLPLFLTVIKKIDLPLKHPLSAKLTIYVEGPTDVAYIKKAATMLGQEALLQGVDLEPIGDQTGQKGGGWKPMAQAFNYLQNKPKLRPNKILFLCDQDVKDGQLPNKGKDFENLLVRRIESHSKEKKGIEWLFAESIFEEAFDKGWIEKDLGRITSHNPTAKITYVIQQKMKVCDWICNERHNTPPDFEGFQNIFHIISDVLSLELAT